VFGGHCLDIFEPFFYRFLLVLGFGADIPAQTTDIFNPFLTNFFAQSID